MTDARPTYPKYKLTKWFLTVTLFFSILTFSGYAGTSQTKVQATQTELLITDKRKTCKRIILYEKSFELSSYNDFVFTPFRNWRNTLVRYNKLTKVKLDSILRQFFSHKLANHFLQVKTISQNSDEDGLVTCL